MSLRATQSHQRMTVISKPEYCLLQKILDSKTKCDLVHSGSCATHVFRIIPGIVISNSKYFVPMVILQLLLNIKKFNSDVLLDAIKYYLGLIYTGSTVGYFSTSFHCFLKAILGRFTVPGIIMLPSAIACHIILWTGEEKAMQLFITSAFQGFIETKLLQRSSFLTKALHDLIPLQTTCFMICSALILYAKQQKKYRGFWFIQPSEAIIDESVNSCQHESIKVCRQYWLEGLRMNVAVGLTLDLFRALLSKTPKHILDIFGKLIWKLKHAKFNTTSFLASYVLIYRVANCWLLRNSVCNNPTQNQVLAAFLGGIAYVFYPNISVLAFGLVVSAQISWSIFKSNSIYDKNAVLYFLKKFPFLRLIFPAVLSYLTHTYAFRNNVSKMSEDMINNLTNHYAKGLMENMHALLGREVKRFAKTSTAI